MLDLKFWFMFMGLLITVMAAVAVVSPAGFKKVLAKEFIEDKNFVRILGFWLWTLGSMMLYSGFMSIYFWASYIVLVVGLIVLLKGIVMVIAPEWCVSLAKKALKWSDNSYRVGASFDFLLGLVVFYSGLFLL